MFTNCHLTQTQLNRSCTTVFLRPPNKALKTLSSHAPSKHPLSRCQTRADRSDLRSGCRRRMGCPSGTDGRKITIDEPGEPPGLFVEAHYEFDLPTPLINAMHRGIALYFAYSFELTKSRWYWL